MVCVDVHWAHSDEYSHQLHLLLCPYPRDDSVALSYSNPDVLAVISVHGLMPLPVHKAALCFGPTVSLSLSPVDLARLVYSEWVGYS